MPNLYYANDQGPVIVEAGVVYERLGQVLGTVNDVSPDVASVGAFTFNVADDQGMVAYTAVQYGVARHLNYYTQLDDDVTIHTVVAAGVLRPWCNEADTGIKVNGLIVGGQLPALEIDAPGINVQPGDEVIFYRRSGFPTWDVLAHFHILPFVYP